MHVGSGRRGLFLLETQPQIQGGKGGDDYARTEEVLKSEGNQRGVEKGAVLECFDGSWAVIFRA